MVWTGVCEAQTWLFMSARKTIGVAAVVSAALDLPLTGQMASAITAIANTRANIEAFFFLAPAAFPRCLITEFLV